MQRSLLDTPIEFLKGIGPQRGEALKKNYKYLPLQIYFSFIHFVMLIEQSFILSAK